MPALGSVACDSQVRSRLTYCPTVVQLDTDLCLRNKRRRYTSPSGRARALLAKTSKHQYFCQQIVLRVSSGRRTPAKVTRGMRYLPVGVSTVARVDQEAILSLSLHQRRHATEASKRRDSVHTLRIQMHTFW